ncbi:Maf-like protein [Ahrensia marina]|uniref:dTTP/UTP pyrophosphatase n=1 Tax=Ahrensia marina TaxID=1514904 RepID=A0A0N0VMJ5_9HYPH|nr:Maf-like protein [Ahrensia marina]KPB02881.1 septum formation inhibitor Maf [Ahrensia marina]
MSVFQKLVLASGSPRRVELLAQAGIEPDRLLPANVDEMPQRAEHPRSLARRLAYDKAHRSLEIMREDGETLENTYILAADTVVSVSRNILPKAELLDEASQSLRMLSGRAHKVHTGICLITPKGKSRSNVVETKVRFKRIPRDEMDAYLASGEWRGKAGGYAIQGLAGTFVVKLVGSYSNVVGLPLYQTTKLLKDEGFDVHFNWLSGAN